jgi:transcriptional regulator with XRE-family HTH domain
MLMKTFGERLRNSILAHGINEAEYARKTDISPQNLSHYIAGQRKPGLDTLTTMLAALPNEHARWLITGKS